MSHLVAVELVHGHPAPPDLRLVEDIVVDQRRHVDHLRDLPQLLLVEFIKVSWRDGGGAAGLRPSWGWLVMKEEDVTRSVLYVCVHVIQACRYEEQNTLNRLVEENTFNVESVASYTSHHTRTHTYTTYIFHHIIRRTNISVTCSKRMFFSHLCLPASNRHKPHGIAIDVI